MIFCNYGGGGYWWFRHSFWYGLTVADVIFPMFVFSMGISITISKKRTFAQILIRSLKMIGLGIFVINAKPGAGFGDLRLPGVLQRLGATYFITACIEHFLDERTEPQNSLSNGLQTNIFADFTGQQFKWITIGLIQITWFLVTFLPKLENCPRGYIGPGGLTDHSQFYNCTAGTSKWLDLKIFSEKHVYPRNPVKHAYFEPESTVFVDPEGVLGTLNCIILAFLGGQVGKIFTLFQTPSGRIGRLLAWSVLTAGLGGMMILLKIPVIKNLWTPSYSFFCCSISFLMISKMYYVIDVSKGIVVKGKVFKMAFYPLQACGRNPILLYVGHEVFRGRVPFVLGLNRSSYVGLFVENVFGTFLWMVIAVCMDRNKFYLRI
jgi:heparan-alpha-glucosaminide N-acetyltransferase